MNGGSFFIGNNEGVVSCCVRLQVHSRQNRHPLCNSIQRVGGGGREAGEGTERVLRTVLSCVWLLQLHGRKGARSTPLFPRPPGQYTILTSPFCQKLTLQHKLTDEILFYAYVLAFALTFCAILIYIKFLTSGI